MMHKVAGTVLQPKVSWSILEGHSCVLEAHKAHLFVPFLDLAPMFLVGLRKRGPGASQSPSTFPIASTGPVVVPRLTPAQGNHKKRPWQAMGQIYGKPAAAAGNDCSYTGLGISPMHRWGTKQWV